MNCQLWPYLGFGQAQVHLNHPALVQLRQGFAQHLDLCTPWVFQWCWHPWNFHILEMLNCILFFFSTFRTFRINLLPAKLKRFPVEVCVWDQAMEHTFFFFPKTQIHYRKVPGEKDADIWRSSDDKLTQNYLSMVMLCSVRFISNSCQFHTNICVIAVPPELAFPLAQHQNWNYFKGKKIQRRSEMTNTLNSLFKKPVNRCHVFLSKAEQWQVLLLALPPPRMMLLQEENQAWIKGADKCLWCLLLLSNRPGTHLHHN